MDFVRRAPSCIKKKRGEEMAQRGAEPKKVIKEALLKAGEALSEIIERRFNPAEISVTYHDPLELPSLPVDNPETLVAAAFYQVEGDLSGYLLLVFSIDEAEAIAQAVLGPEAADEALVDSALGEIGNIVGSSFLNYLADYFSIYAAPTPPQVVRDMLGALMETLAAVAAAEGRTQVPVIRTTFAQEEGTVTAFLLWVTDVEDIRRLGSK